MRPLLLALLLAACSPQVPDQPPERSLYAGEGRDRLCLAGNRAGFIVYGTGDANCSARGRLERQGAIGSFVPDGDEDCRIALSFADETVKFDTGQAACAYYCGPGADFAGKGFTRSDSASPAVDFAGDPLC